MELSQPQCKPRLPGVNIEKGDLGAKTPIGLMFAQGTKGLLFCSGASSGRVEGKRLRALCVQVLIGAGTL